MIEFPYVKLADLCTVNQGLQIPISKRYREKGEGRYFYITVQFLKVSHNEKYYVENPPKSSICEKDDIIVVRTGSTGQIVTGVEGCFHNNFFKVNHKKDKVHSRYLYYCLKSKEKQKEMKNRSGITTIPDLNHFMFLDMKIPLPAYSVQVEVAKVIDSVSSKIEVNNKINAELEAMAKTIYDYWFVQFDFPNENGKPYKSSGGKMVFNEELKREFPEGWESGELSDIANINMGQSPPGESYNEEGVGEVFYQGCTDFGSRFPSNRKFTTKPSRYAKKGDILLSVRAPVGTMNIASEDCCIGRGLASLNSKDNCISYLDGVLQYMKQIFDRRNSSGTTFGSITKGDLFSLSVVKPNEEILKQFDTIAKPMFDKQNLIGLENQQLSELRDWLLPMLMNGQVRVK